MNRAAPASNRNARNFGRAALTIAALLSLSGVAQAQLVQPPPPAAKPTQPAKIDDLKKAQPPVPASAQPANRQPIADQPAEQPKVDPSTIKERPDMIFEEQHHSFGKIADTDDANFVFKFTNKGNQKLVISDMHATCGCTLPNMEKKEYEPGESGEINVKYNPRNKHGVQNQTVTITTNDPVNQRIMLTIQAEVQPVVSVDPLIAQAGVVHKGEERKVTVTITMRDPESKVTDVTSSSPDTVKIAIVKSEKIELDGKPAYRATLEATIAPNHPVGRIQASGTVRTTDKNKPIVNFQVLGELQGDIFMQPARLSFGQVRPNEALKTSAKVSHRDGKPFKINSIAVDTTSKAELQVTFKPNDPANPTEYSVEVTGTAGPEPMVIRGDLILTTEVKGETTIRLPFFGTIRAAQ